MVAQYRHKVFRYFRRFRFVLAKTYPATNSLHLEIDGRLLLGWPVVYYICCFALQDTPRNTNMWVPFKCRNLEDHGKACERLVRLPSDLTLGDDEMSTLSHATLQLQPTKTTVFSPCPAGGKSSTNAAECRTTSTSGKQRAVEFERCQGRRYSQRFTGHVSRRSEESGRCLEDCGKRHDGKSGTHLQVFFG